MDQDGSETIALGAVDVDLTPPEQCTKTEGDSSVYP